MLIRTWLTEPGIIMRNPTVNKHFEEPTIGIFNCNVINLVQRRVGGLMVSVKNNRSDYVIVMDI